MIRFSTSNHHNVMTYNLKKERMKKFHDIEM